MIVALVPIADVESVWLQATKLLASAIDLCRGFTLADVKARLLEDTMQLWLVLDDDVVVGVGTTNIGVYPQTKELEIVHLGGTDVPKWHRKFNEEVGEFAKANGCESLVCHVKGGARARLFSRYGYQEDFIVLRREV